ncbi:tetratricopeptide repeat protein [Streptomyces roseifaciens]|uniref:tetratricopeptide repeat protein n=1 Tax=Streptomyces roseifaciens TaxID=1488406 RepID=UPI0007181813|nr:tetratricopeptide repeat protein [Streptomyces roseifaciens]
MLIGERIRALRMERGWSLSQLSQLVNYSKSYLSRVENGTRAVSPELARLCDRVMDADGELTRLVTAAGPPALGCREPEARTAEARTAGARTEEARAAEGRRRPLPAQLPAAGEMWGRDGELARAEALLARHPGPSVLVVDGMGGAGKTTFAVSLARRLGPSYPDGALFTDLRAHGPDGSPAVPGDVAAGLLRALGAAPEDIAVEPAERAALLRSVLAERRVVMVLDDADSASQVAPLLPGTGHSLVLVTSRRRLTGLSVRHDAMRLSLEPMSADEAVLLLRRALDRRAVSPAAALPEPVPHEAVPAGSPAGDVVLAAIAHRCAYLPLALRIAAERVAERGPVFAAALAEELGGASSRLDALAVPGEAETAVRPVFACSYRTLPEKQARAFRLLARHPGVVAGVDAVAALLGEPPAVALRLLGELHAAHLVAEVAPGRYRMHDLLREYAGERAEAEESPEALAASTGRVLGWYLHTAEAAADQLLGLGRHRVPLDPLPEGCRPRRFASVTEALEWYEHERVNLLACARAARAAGSTVAWQLPHALWSFSFLRHHHHDQLEAGRIARGAAAPGAALAEACAELVLASACAGLRRHATADGHYRRAIERFAAAGDHTGEGGVLLGYALSCMRQGRVAEANGHVERALELFTAAGSAWGTAMALFALGEALLAQGRPRAALAPLSRARELHRTHGSLWLQASSWTLTGTAYRDLGEHTSAEDCYRAALELHGRTGMLAGTAQALHQLGICLSLQGRAQQARRAWLRAWAVYEALADPREQDVRRSLAGLAPCRAADGGGPGQVAGSRVGRPALPAS